MSNKNRVILNTGFLYANMVVSMVVQLVSIPILLSALGVTDYGIYAIVAGVVSLFAFMNVAMAAATQRFLSFAIGNGDKKKIKELFYQSVVLHLGIALIVVTLLELGGLYYIENFLKAPAERMQAATLLLHCITASTFVNIITVPYEADINANEDMGAIAAINILDALMKLGIAVFIGYVTADRLKVYGFLLMCTLTTTLLLKRIYCRIKYDESKFRWHRITDTKDMKDMVSFALWSLIGSGCSIARYQGTSVILNRFFGIAINTPYGIAQQVNALFVFFANTIVRAIRPQIVKSEGAGNRKRMLMLSETTCKVTSIMVALMAIPLFVNMESVLRLWLHRTPSEECVMFCQSFLVIVFINQLTIGLQIAVESVGQIKTLQRTVGFMHILSLPIGYICFCLGMAPSSIMLCIIAEEIIALFTRVCIAKRIVHLPAASFLTRTILPSVVVVMLTFLISSTFATFIKTSDFISCLLLFPLSIILLTALSYSLALSEQEKRFVQDFLLSIKNKVTRHSSSTLK